jgi:hypothetical protein
VKVRGLGAVGLVQTARDLRQTSPLAGMLSEPERRRIIEEVR